MFKHPNMSNINQTLFKKLLLRWKNCNNRGKQIIGVGTRKRSENDYSSLYSNAFSRSSIIEKTTNLTIKFRVFHKN